MSAGARNCQTDTPAERATANSSRRDRLRNAPIAPISTMNGSSLFGDNRRVQHREPGDRCAPFAPLRLAGAAQRIDEIDREDQRQHGGEHAEHRRQA